MRLGDDHVVGEDGIKAFGKHLKKQELGARPTLQRCDHLLQDTPIRWPGRLLWRRQRETFAPQPTDNGPELPDELQQSILRIIVKRRKFGAEHSDRTQ
jgi:hypothetical protein